MLKGYLICAYVYLVKIVEPVEGGTKSVVPEDYRIAVSEYLVSY